MSSASARGTSRRTQMFVESTIPVNGERSTSSTSSTNSWNLSFSFSRTCSTAAGGLGTLVADSDFTFPCPLIPFTEFCDAVLVWLTAKNRKLKVTNAQAIRASQRMAVPTGFTNRQPFGHPRGDAARAGGGTESGRHVRRDIRRACDRATFVGL